MTTFKMLLPYRENAFNPPLSCIDLIRARNTTDKADSLGQIIALIEACMEQNDVDYVGISTGNCLLDCSFDNAENPIEFSATDVMTTEVLHEIGYGDDGAASIPSAARVVAPFKSSWMSNLCMSEIESHLMWYWWHRKSTDLATLREILRTNFPDFLKDVDNYESDEIGYPLGSFLMAKETFEQFAEWSVAILEQHPCKNKSYLDSPWPESIEARIVFTHLFGVFVKHIERANGKEAIVHAPCVYFDDASSPYLKPAFSENNIAIVFAADGQYAPLASVAIESVIENATQDNNYDIIVFDTGLTNADRELIRQQATTKSNVSIRFVKIAEKALDDELPTHAHINTSAYARLYILEFLKAYQKVVYLDCDLVCNEDVANLYRIDVSDVYLAAVRDSADGGWINIVDSDALKYIHESVGLDEANDYFNSGVLVVNVTAMGAATSSAELIAMSKSRKWRWEDQDVLNCFAAKKVQFLDPSWNFMAHKESYFTPELLPEMWLSVNRQNEYRTSHGQPKIVHYVGKSTPCFEPYADLAWNFWRYARNTPYYEILTSLAAKSLQVTSLQPSRRPSRNLKFGPLVSIVMPVYNAAPYLKKSLESLLYQTYHNLEIICVNDGSVDNSLQILEGFTRKDSRVKVIDKPNSGAGETRNLGMKHVRGRYMCFVDSDDFVERNMIERLVDVAEEHGTDTVVFGMDTYDHVTGEFTPLEYAVSKEMIPVEKVFYAADIDNFYKYLVGFTVNKLYRSSFLLGLDLAFPKIGAHEDMPFTYLALSASKRTFYLDETLYHYRRSREGSLSDTTSNHYRYMFDALDCLRTELIDHNLWNDYERIFTNYALHMMIWKHQELDRPRKLEFRDTCRTKWLDHYDIASKDTNYFFDEEDYGFVASTVNMQLSRRIAAKLLRKKIQTEDER